MKDCFLEQKKLKKTKKKSYKYNTNVKTDNKKLDKYSFDKLEGKQKFV